MRYLNAGFIGYALRKKFPGPYSRCLDYSHEFVGDDGPIICSPRELRIASPIFKGLSEAQQRQIVTSTLKMEIKGLDKEIDEMNIKTKANDEDTDSFLFSFGIGPENFRPKESPN